MKKAFLILFVCVLASTIMCLVLTGVLSVHVNWATEEFSEIDFEEDYQYPSNVYEYYVYSKYFLHAPLGIEISNCAIDEFTPTIPITFYIYKSPDRKHWHHVGSFVMNIFEEAKLTQIVPLYNIQIGSSGRPIFPYWRLGARGLEDYLDDVVIEIY